MKVPSKVMRAECGTVARHCLSVAVLAAISALVVAEPIYAQQRRESAPQQYSITAGSLGAALNQLAAQSKLQIVYSPELVRGRTAPAFSGTLTWRAALERLLAGSGLEWGLVNDTTVVIKARQTAPASQKRDPVTTSPAPASSETLDLETIIVTGTRIRRDPMEATVSPVTVFNRQEIDRTGATSVADFLGFITQNDRRALDREVSGDPLTGRTTIDLRGLGNNTTLVLVNGRRLPKTGQGFGLDDYNLNAIPMGAIERIEVLTNSASAIYGSDAIGGVVNIITRRDYTGAEFTAQYGNTTRSDSAERSFNLTLGKEGQLFEGPQYSVTLNLSSRESDGLAAADRPYTAAPDYSSSGGRPLFLPHPIFSRIAGPGSVVRLDGLLPGLDTDWVAIPAGQDGRSLTIADFDPSTPMTTTQAEIPKYRLLIAPEEQHSASFSGKLYLTNNVELFTDISYSVERAHTYGVPPSALIPVPASNPFNPFGVDVLVNKVFYELGPSRKEVESKTSSTVFGLRGSLGDRWRYELSADFARAVERTDNIVPPTINFFPIITPLPGGGYTVEPSPGWTAINETDPSRALNVFGDARTTQPNDTNLIYSLIGIDKYTETSSNMTYSFTADGAIAAIPGGDIKLAVGAEYRKQKSWFDKINNTGETYISLDDGAKHHSSAGFMELSVPIIGEHQNIRGVRSLELSLAGRVDSESFFGSEFTPKYGVLWKPSDSFTMRASYSRGYKVPSIQQLLMPEETIQTYLNVADPVTGQPVGLVPVLLGGNPDLEPERSSSWSAGFIYEPRWIKNLSLSIDYFDITFENKVVGPFVDAEAILQYVPERVQRDPQTNQITLIDTRTLNLASATARGMDVKLSHRTETESYGAFDTRLNYTYNLENKEQLLPGTAEVDRLDESIPRVRANASVFWSRRGYELGTNITYESSTRNIFHTIWGIQPERVEHGISVDLQAGLDLGTVWRGERGPAWLENTKLTLGVINVFDREPSPIDGDGGYAKLDPRQRRYYLMLRKAF